MRDDYLVSCLTCTYGRPIVLGEAIKCFIDQDYDNKELIILNDQVGVELVIENCPNNIKIYNHSERFESLGAKRNYIKTLSNGDYYCIWDDDDLYTPWRIKSSVRMMRDKSRDIVKSKDAFFSINNTNYKIANNLFHSQACIRKEYMLKTSYPNKSVGEDYDFEKGANVEFSYGVMPWYVYRWGNCGVSGGIHHLSGIRDEKESWNKSLIFKPYNDIKGKITITSGFQRNYWMDIAKFLKDTKSCYSFEWNKRFDF